MSHPTTTDSAKGVEVNSLQNLFFYELKDAFHAEKIGKEELPKIKRHLCEMQTKELINELLHSFSERIDELKKIFEELHVAPQETTSFAAEGLLQELHDLIQRSHSSAILDAGILGILSKFIGYQKANYETLVTYIATLKNYPEMERRLKRCASSLEKEKKALFKSLEGSFFQEGVEEHAFAESPILT